MALFFAVILQIIVDFLLIVGTNKLLEEPIPILRAVLGAVIGGLFSAVCIRIPFMRETWWLLAGVLLSSAVSYAGISLRSGAVYFLLRIAMNGIVSDSAGWEHMFWAIVLWAVWLYGIHTGKRKMIPIELRLGTRTAKLQGLVDTGNSLVDPITGRQVLVVDADIADKLTGLTKQQLMKPVESMCVIPGLRLIPYKTVGQSGGLLLAIQVPETKIGNWRGSTLVAFSPQILDEYGNYQALIGGMI